MMALNGIENYNLDKRVVRIVGDSENIYLVFEDVNRIGYNEKQNSYTFVTSSGIYEMSSPEFDDRFEALSPRRGIDISCAWDEHFCFVTAQFECN